jgi:hypothetical protein
MTRELHKQRHILYFRDTSEGTVHKARRLLEDAYVIGEHIAATNDGTQLLCGAKYAKKLPADSSSHSQWLWRPNTPARLKSKLVATNLKPKEGKPSDHYKALDKAQRKRNRQPKGHIFDSASDKPNPELRVSWKETQPAAHKVEPSPVRRVSKCLDPDDEEQDIDEFWASVAADTTTLAGRLGLLASTMTTPEPAEHNMIMGMEESEFEALAKADNNKKPTPKRPASTKPKR